MLESDDILGLLSEAQSRLSDRINLFIDNELPDRQLSRREIAFIEKASEHIMIAEELIKLLEDHFKNE